MDRIRELEVAAQEKREALKSTLAEARKGSTPELSDRMATLTADLEALDRELRAERAVVDADRGGPAPGRLPMGGELPAADDDPPALMLPPLPARTRRKLEAMAGRPSM